MSVLTKREQEQATARAWRAVKRFNSYKRNLEGMVEALAGRRIPIQVGVGTGHSESSTDGSKIYITPPIELGDEVEHVRSLCDKRGDGGRGLQLCPACQLQEQVLVMMFHELGHNVFRSFGKAAEWKSKHPASFREFMELSMPDDLRYKLDRPVPRIDLSEVLDRHSEFTHFIANVLEDVRIDTKMFRERPGYADMMRARTTSIFEKGNQGADGSRIKWSDAPINSQAAIALLLIGHRQEELLEYLHQEVRTIARDERVRELCEGARAADNCYEVAVIAVKAVDRLRELGFLDGIKRAPEPEPEPEPEQQEESEDARPTDSSGGSSDRGDQSGREDDQGAGVSDPSEGRSEQGSDQPEGDIREDEEGSSEGDPESGSEDHEAREAARGEGPGDQGPEGSEPSSREAGSEAPTGGGEDDALPDGGEEQEDRTGGGERASDEGESGTPGRKQEDAAGPGGDEGYPDGGEDGDRETDGGEDGTGESGQGGSGEGEHRRSESGGDGAVPEGTQRSGSEERDERGGAGDGEPSEEESGTEPEAGAGGADDQADLDQPGGEHEPAVSERDRGDLDDDGGASGGSDAGSEERGDGGSDGGSDGQAQGGRAGSGRLSSDGGASLGTPGESAGDQRGNVGGPATSQPAPSDPAARHWGELADGDRSDVGRAVRALLGHSEIDPTSQEEDSDLDEDGNYRPYKERKAEQEVKDILIQAIEQVGKFDSASSNIVGRVVVEASSDGTFQQAAKNAGVFDTEEMEGYGHTDPSEFKVSEATLGKALMGLRAAFEENDRTRFQPHLKSGKINTRMLGKRAPMGDPRLFRKKMQPKKRDYAVLISIDVSGSTWNGTRLLDEKRAAAAQAELLDRLGVSFAMVAHTGSLIESGSSRGYGFGAVFFSVKDWDEPWNKHTQERLGSLAPFGANIDGHSLEYLRKKVLARKAEQRIIIYYSDGAMPYHNFSEELEILQREIKNCEDSGVLLFGVGINTDSPEKHGLPTVQVDSEQDIQKVVEHTRKALAKFT